jgi:hypothetical protein
MLALYCIGLFMGSHRERPFTWDITLKRFPRSVVVNEVASHHSCRNSATVKWSSIGRDMSCQLSDGFLRSGGTRIRTGDTMIFSHIPRPLGMRKTRIGQRIFVHRVSLDIG